MKEELDDILNRDIDMIDKTIELLLYVTKKQLFLDGNKRTAVLFANHYLISHAKGIIVVSTERGDEYKKFLIDYYEDKNEDIKSFLKAILPDKNEVGIICPMHQIDHTGIIKVFLSSADN